MEDALWDGAEIVSGDSVQIYRGLDIGTDKAPAELRAATPHHLVDALGFDESYSANDFATRARAAIRVRPRPPPVSTTAPAPCCC